MLNTNIHSAIINLMAVKKKSGLKFDQRNFKTTPLAKVMPCLMRTLGHSSSAKKSVTLIRIINHWPDIIGQDMALHTTPLKIGYKKKKCDQTGELKSTSILRIRCEGALGTMIAMRQNIIVERLNRLFGAPYFSDIQIEHGTVSASKPAIKKPAPIHFDLNLPDIDDPILKTRLESLGQAVMNKSKNN